jgi:hypothetical protein
MKRGMLALTIAAACLGWAAAAWSAYLEGDEPAEQGPGRIAPPEPVGPPEPFVPPRPENPLVRTVRRITVREPHTYRGLTVFQLELGRVDDDTDYDSLDEAIRRGTLTIREKGDGSVPTLMAQNRGRQAVLMLAGEIVLGGKQNRILQRDVLLPGRSGWVELPVYCVERGRWTGRSGAFAESSQVAGANVRALAIAQVGQAEIWSGVDEYQTRLGVRADTGDLQTVQESPEVREAVDAYRRDFRPHWRPQAVGVVVARHGVIVGADVFCNARVFWKHRERILDSYAVDCYSILRQSERGGRERFVPRPLPACREAERFLQRVYGARFSDLETPGTGRLVEVRGENVRGLALSRGEALLHAGLFAVPQFVPLPLGPQPHRPPGLRILPEPGN